MFLKNIIILLFTVTTLSTSLVAQIKNEYASHWKKVSDYEKKGLTKSALKEVIAIYKLAIRDHNDAQQIKSCMYQVMYRNMVEEDNWENNILFVDTMIAKAGTPAKNILQSMQAEMFWQFLQNNRYKLYNRTKLMEEKSKDINTWSLPKIQSTIARLYKASIGNENILKETKLEGYEPVIMKGQNTRQLRPTLFDFLAHRALEYFMNDEHDITKPAYYFTISDPKAFSPASEFVQSSFSTKDTGSLHYKAIGVLREILKFHLKDINSNALLDADLVRLEFMHQYSVLENKTKLYEEALKNIEVTYAGNQGIAQAMYLRARIYYDKGKDFQPFTKPGNQYEIKRAKEICDKATRQFPKTEGGINCTNLSNLIIQPSLNLVSEKVNIPGQPFRILVKYKNTSKVYFRIIQITHEELKKLDRGNYEKLWKQMIDMKYIRNWNVSMPDLQDYQEHAAEIKADALSNGMYFILASLDETFSLQKNILAKQLIYQSNISYIHNSNNEYNVLHRDNGQPLPNTIVQVWETKYNYTTSKNDETKAESYTTDKNGYFKLKENREYRSFLLQLNHKKDELFLDENNYNNYYNSYEQELTPVTFLFTDRSVYRPGQTVYFKGIVLKKSNKPTETSIVTNSNSTLVLKDVNGQKIAEVKMVTNEYGSYHGSFKIPEGLLNGQFSIFDETTSSTLFFTVEEYKRPKFFVEVLQPTGTFRLFDTVKVTGAAKAYAGNIIDGATVQYRVIRKVRYPIWWGQGYGHKILPPGRSSDEVEIINGSVVTDSRGEFKISFVAIPDESILKKDQPIFYYEVNADVTDLNGETRSSETSIRVAYQALQLNIDVADKLNADSLKNLKIRSTNTNDIFEKTKVNVTIHKVQSPNKIFRGRYWEMPDKFVMSKDEFDGYFPYDVYKDEDQAGNWPLGEKVFDQTDSTQLNGHWATGNISLRNAWYKIVATTRDKYGEEVRAEKFILIQPVDQRKGDAEVMNAVTVINDQAFAEPGKKINYTIQTGFENIWLIHTVSRMNKTHNTTYHTIKKGQPFQNEENVSETDRGGLSVSYVFVQHNRVYKGDENISIPWNNKELIISYQTFRNKTLPGSNEKWMVKISGSKGEKIAAEMLVSMYDASLDQFKPHNWSALNIWPGLSTPAIWSENGFNAVNSEEYNLNVFDYLPTNPKSYDRLLSVFSYYGNNSAYRRRNTELEKLSRDGAMKSAPISDNVAMNAEKLQVTDSAISSPPGPPGNEEEMAQLKIKKDQQQMKQDNSRVRKNFAETAFFFPDLTTDKDGNVSFGFTIPEALTQWKLMTFAHTKKLASGYSEKTVVTQKTLMVQPNAPRFLREGDRIEFSTKIVNLGEKEITGTAHLELLDASTNQPIDDRFKNISPIQNFTIAAGQSIALKFPLEVPKNFNSALTYRIIAKSRDNITNESGEIFSDGEELTLPVLINRMLVTESLPLNLRNTNKKNFTFEKLLNSGSSSSITNHAITVEYTTNPAWFAVQALPYLMEYPNECSEHIFNRYYANTLASYLSNRMPKIKAVFDIWKTLDTSALISNLQKNEELKSALLQETPWILDSKNENQQKKNIALLFDMVKLASETEKSINKLKEMQSSNGGFVWFKGGADDRYMTQYILAGIGHLRKLNALPEADFKKIKLVVDKALTYLDKKIQQDYENLLKNKANLKNNNLGYTSIQYLYMRSFFIENTIPAHAQPGYNYFRSQAKKYWLANNKYMQAMIALALNRTNDEVTPKAIIRSLKENSILKDEMGMYWKEFTTGGYYWHQAPIESQAMMIEAFSDIDKNTNTINDLKTWLLKQKQTQNWKTTKATAEACYALLLGGSNWLKEENEFEIKLGNTQFSSSDDKVEAGTGYFKKRIPGESVKPAMGKIQVHINSSDNITTSPGSWGAVYWQYFEEIDKITEAATPLQLKKKLFVEVNADKGPILKEIYDGAILKVGEKVKIRIELRVDRDMEYVHMKDMRAACMEPVNFISEYKYQGGLGYYESTKDASTNFFFSWLARGTYVFEFPLFVTHAGNFSNGITTIQSMYAPEFTSHSDGIRVNVENR